MWLSDLRVVLPTGELERGSLRIDGGRICQIIEGPTPIRSGEAIIGGEGLTAIPGIIDLHGDMLEREMEPRPGTRFPTDMAVFELDKRLAAAGVTTAFATVTFAVYKLSEDLRSNERAREIVSTITGLRRSLLVDIRVHARFDINNPSAVPVLMELLRDRQVDLVSLNDHTPGQGQYRDIEAYIEFIARWRKISVEEAQRMTEERLKQAKEAPPSWDVARQVASVAREHGLCVASHDDDTPAKVRLVSGFGACISEFPVTMEAAWEARRIGMSIAMGAPNVLQGYSHAGNLSALEAIEAGLVDVLVADYHPATLLHAAFALAQRGILPLHEAVGLVTANPARALGLDGRGRIEVGAEADLVLLGESEGLRVRGVLRSGVPVYWDRTMVNRARSERVFQPA